VGLVCSNLGQCVGVSCVCVCVGGGSSGKCATSSTLVIRQSKRLAALEHIDVHSVIA